MWKSTVALTLLFIPRFWAQSTTTGSAPPALSTPASNFNWSQPFPQPWTIPTPKPEWTTLLANVTVVDAPISSVDPEGVLIPPSVDNYCSWTFSKCYAPDDIYNCTRGQWSLTFDDGPTPATTDLITYLESQQIRAAFFLLGGQVIQYPEIVQQLYNAGHEIAIHTWSHTPMSTLTNEQIIAELKWTEEAIREIIGVSPRFFRPPQGDVDNRVRSIARALGFTNVLWSHDTFDYYLGSNLTTIAEIENTVRGWAAEATNSTLGGISLEHDIDPRYVQAAINNVIPILQDAYNFTSVATCGGLTSSYKEGTPNPQPSSGVTPTAEPSTPSESASDQIGVEGGAPLLTTSHIGVVATLLAAVALVL